MLPNFEISNVTSFEREFHEEFSGTNKKYIFADDFIDAEDIGDIAASPSNMNINISEIKITTVEEALEIAQQIMDVLEDDVNLYLQTTGYTLPDRTKPIEEE